MQILYDLRFYELGKVERQNDDFQVLPIRQGVIVFTLQGFLHSETEGQIL